MKQGYLSQYFKGVAVKTLSAVEADPIKSNQHEFNGVAPLKKIFGVEKQKFETRFIYLSDSIDEPLTDDGFLTWYESRKPPRSEYRMYYSATTISKCASIGDDLFICLKPDNSILAIVAENCSTIANQIRWLFGVSKSPHPNFSIRENLESEQDRIAFASRLILEQIGIEVKADGKEESYLEDMLHLFAGGFPKTKEFSAYARSTLSNVSPLDNPDTVLLSWMEREEILFRTLEKHLIAEHLSSGDFFVKPDSDGALNVDVDGFISYSLSIQNRRKSRVGQALENHVEQLFASRGIQYDRAKITENKAKPDFIFPGIKQYHDNTFNITLLTMLGVKSTCKDRWRQVLTEADKIQNKHLLTLEAAISENQTTQMQSQNLQLVIPVDILSTYSESQQKCLMNLDNFIRLIFKKQSSALTAF